jgi:hypothetical protein
LRIPSLGPLAFRFWRAAFTGSETVRLFYSNNANFSGDGFSGYFRGYVGWAATFLIFLFLFLTLFLFVSREMMFAVVAVTTMVTLLLPLAWWLFKLRTRHLAVRGSFTEVGSRARERTAVQPKLIEHEKNRSGDGRLRDSVVMLGGDGRTFFLFAHYGDNEATVYSSFIPPEPVAEEDLIRVVSRFARGSLVP